MDAFPHASELQFLVGKQLTEIRFRANSVQFRWWEGGRIDAMSAIEHVDESGKTHRYDNASFSGPPILLHRLISKRIATLSVEPLRLTLVFEGGQKLRLFAEWGRGECGLILFGEEMTDGYFIY